MSGEQVIAPLKSSKEPGYQANDTQHYSLLSDTGTEYSQNERDANISLQDHHRISRVSLPSKSTGQLMTVHKKSGAPVQNIYHESSPQPYAKPLKFDADEISTDYTREDSLRSVGTQDDSRMDSLKQTWSPFTPRGAATFFRERMQPGSLYTSVFTTVVSIVGAGTLATPFSLRMFGLVPGVILLIISALITNFSMDLLILTANYVPADVRPSYRGIANAALGPKLAKFVHAVLITQLYGCVISYIVAYAGIIDLAWNVLFGGRVYTYAALVLTLGVVFPLSLLRSMRALSFTSLLGFCCISYLVIVLMVEYFLLCDTQVAFSGDDTVSDKSTCFWKSNFHITTEELFPIKDGWKSIISGLFTALPLQLFDFCGHQNVIPIYVELQNRSRKVMKKVLQYNYVIQYLFYTIAAIFGYLTFLKGTCSNVLLNNFHKHPQIIIAGLMIAMSCCFTEVCFVFACRLNISMLIFGNKNTQLPTVKHVALTLVIIGSALLIAIFVTDIGVVFGLLGASTYPLTGFVFPTIFFLKLIPRNRYKWTRIIAIAQMVIIGSISCGSFVYKVYTYVNPDVSSSPSCEKMQNI